MPLNEDLLQQMLSIINKYKQGFGALDNPLSNKHPFFDKKYADDFIKFDLKIFDLEDLNNNFHVLASDFKF